MRLFRKAAYLCSVSPGASLELSETDTEVLDKEMVKYCRGPACRSRSRVLTGPQRGHLPPARHTWTHCRDSDKYTQDLVCRLMALTFSGSNFTLPENEIKTKAHAEKHEILTFMFHF